MVPYVSSAARSRSRRVIPERSSAADSASVEYAPCSVTRRITESARALGESFTDLGAVPAHELRGGHAPPSRWRHLERRQGPFTTSHEERLALDQENRSRLTHALVCRCPEHLEHLAPEPSRRRGSRSQCTHPPDQLLRRADPIEPPVGSGEPRGMRRPGVVLRRRLQIARHETID